MQQNAPAEVGMRKGTASPGTSKPKKAAARKRKDWQPGPRKTSTRAPSAKAKAIKRRTDSADTGGYADENTASQGTAQPPRISQADLVQPAEGALRAEKRKHDASGSARNSSPSPSSALLKLLVLRKRLRDVGIMFCKGCSGCYKCCSAGWCCACQPADCPLLRHRACHTPVAHCRDQEDSPVVGRRRRARRSSRDPPQAHSEASGCWKSREGADWRCVSSCACTRCFGVEGSGSTEVCSLIALSSCVGLKSGRQRSACSTACSSAHSCACSCRCAAVQAAAPASSRWPAATTPPGR